MKQIAAYSLCDYFILSTKPEILQYTVEQDSKARGILDYTTLSAHEMTEDDPVCHPCNGQLLLRPCGAAA